MRSLNLVPDVKYLSGGGGSGRRIQRLLFDLPTAALQPVVRSRLWNLPGLGCSFATPTGEEPGLLIVTLRIAPPAGPVPAGLDADRLRRCGYSLSVAAGTCRISSATHEGLVNALSTLVQLLTAAGDEPRIADLSILDYPSLDVRSLSTTFAWYAGYGRIGFDSQLWGLEEWKRFLDICADFKINQLNMCMYGYWPFAFPEYPETCLRDIPMKVWNPESRSWVWIAYTHPNLVKEFLPDLIAYAHSLAVRIFAYVGLNSYNGGYSNIHRDKRMKLPHGSRFVNDFDSLCLSDAGNIEYLEACMRRLVGLGLDGIVFEESEEAYWFCSCPACTTAYGDRTPTPAEAKHEANYVLLRTLHAVIKRENPRCEVGLRAWREPPLEKGEQYLRHCAESIPGDVSLYWAPGLYVPEAEMDKWIAAFGAHRICARDTESNAWSSTQGRLMRIFKTNVLRSAEEGGDQFIEKDIVQHRGSVARGVRGINGYLFEWYGYFLHLLAHAFYGWGCDEPEDAFCRRAVSRLVGEEMAADVLFVLRNMLTIHESQLKIFPAAFPFQKNKVSANDLPAIRRAQKQWPAIEAALQRILQRCDASPRLAAYAPHFRKISNSHHRNRHIYDMCLASVAYEAENDPARKRQHLLDMEKANEADFALVRAMYLDVQPVDRTGVKSCMYPYHELKRVLDNALGRSTPPDGQMIFLGVEALGWLWI